MRGIRIISVTLAAILFAVLLIPGTVLADEGYIGLDVKPRTPDQIKAYARSVGLTGAQGVEYAESPSLSQPYSAGTLSKPTKDAYVAALSFMRFVAGLDPITWDDSAENEAQAAALISLLNGTISHYPARPAGVSNELFELGSLGCSSSNLEMDNSFDVLTPLSCMIDWMNDSDNMNIDRVGHRRWCLNPRMGKSAYGAIRTSTGGYAAMTTFDYSNSSADIDYVAWPAANMPSEFFTDGMAWSLSMPNIPNDTVVSVVRRSDGREWTLKYGSSDGYFNISEGGYGSGECVIFVPNGATNNSGDEYDVTVTGPDKPLKYTVSFFALGIDLGNAAALNPPPKPQNVTAEFYDEQRAHLSWKNIADVDGYEIQRSTDGENFKTVGEDVWDDFIDKGIDYNTTYYYRVRAYIDTRLGTVYGPFSDIVKLEAKKPKPTQTQEPSKPSDDTPSKPSAAPSVDAWAGSGLKATLKGTASAKVSWNAIKGAVGYELWRSADKKSYKKVYSGSAKLYTDPKLIVGKAYYYKVRPFKKNGAKNEYGKYSAVVTLKVAPTAVTGVKAPAPGRNKTNITWAKTANASGYQVFRSADGKNFRKVYTAPKGTIVKFTDAKLKANTKYYYKVRAYSGTGAAKIYGAYSKTVTVRTKK